MKPLRTGLLLTLIFMPTFAQESADGPTDPKARKSYQEGLNHLQKHNTEMALDNFKKADKQDGGHCAACQEQMIRLGEKIGDWKVAERGAEERAAGAKNERDKALAAVPRFPAAIFGDGRALAYLKQDEAAKARFEEFAKMSPPDNIDRQRALRFITYPELARAKMAPPFSVTTLDGQRVSMDELKGKVVLIDFWATWCGPCREALPHMKDIAKKFNGQPLVILSVSLDENEQTWKEFVAKNGMDWAQYRDAGFEGPVARSFAVTAIPHTFTIDVDGVLQDEHIGDAAIEGKLKKLVARAREIDATKTN